VSGSARRARRLAGALRTDASLADLVSAGAELDPGLVLRGFAYAVPSAWTHDQRWAVDLHLDGGVLSVATAQGGGLTATDGSHDGEPDARVRLSGEDFRSLLAGGSPELSTEGDEQVVRRLLALADRVLRPGLD
ncbi:MAG: hypothetical protein ACR2NB_03960, partial [Solirubrobacteraceae bacterium]